MSIKDDLSITSEDLDELVHEEMATKAAAINNEGKSEQLAFLEERGWSEADIRDWLLTQHSESD